MKLHNTSYATMDAEGALNTIYQALVGYALIDQMDDLMPQDDDTRAAMAILHAALDRAGEIGTPVYVDSAGAKGASE
jgi:hypothetical protein